MLIVFNGTINSNLNLFCSILSIYSRSNKSRPVVWNLFKCSNKINEHVFFTFSLSLLFWATLSMGYNEWDIYFNDIMPCNVLPNENRTFNFFLSSLVLFYKCVWICVVEVSGCMSMFISLEIEFKPTKPKLRCKRNIYRIDLKKNHVQTYDIHIWYRKVSRSLKINNPVFTVIIDLKWFSVLMDSCVFGSHFFSFCVPVVFSLSFTQIWLFISVKSQIARLNSHKICLSA